MRTILLAAVMALLATNAWAFNINTSHSNIKNLLNKPPVTTATTNLSGPSDTQTVYTAPAVGDFLLTQFCASVVSGGVQLSVAGLGGIAQTGLSGSCVTFTPGVSVPQSAAVTCSTTAAVPGGTTVFCTINGLQTAK